MVLLGPAFAEAAVFSLAGPAATGVQGGALEGLSTGSTSVSGITGTFTAITTGVSGTFHQTSGNFGINSDDGIVGTSDATSQLDAVEGTESLTITFNTNVTLDSVTLSSFSTGTQLGAGNADETASLKIGSNSTQTLTATSSASDVYNFASNNSVTAGQAVTLGYLSTTGSNGFSFDAFSVTAVPEPASIGLLAVGSLMALRRRRA